MKVKRTTIRVGQRLNFWDGTKGYVQLNTQVSQFYHPGESFKVAWLDHDGSVLEETYYCLEDFEAEGITFGRGLMPWAK